MRAFATHTASLRRVAGAAAAVLLLAAGCPADGGGVDLDRAILLGDASDTVLSAMSDAVDSGQLQVDDDQAAALVTPEPGAVLDRATPAQFAWSLPGQKARRGSVTSGEFVWLSLTGGGLSREIDVLAVGVTSWTPSASDWAEISAATGPVTLTLTSAAVENGAIAAGPYRASAAATFTIAP